MQVGEDTIAVRPGEQFDAEKVGHLLRQQLADIGEGEVLVRQFPSGASNLTYLIRVGEWEGVLRRPPSGPIPPKAHDMAREFSLLSKIHPVFPLAPRPYLLCEDLSIMGVPFYIMERRRGIVLNDRFPLGIQVSPKLCQRLSTTVIETLVQIHAIDWQAAGLQDLGHPEGFLARQIKGWIERYTRARTDDIPMVEPLMQWLSTHIPTSPAATLIHNDFKLNNMLLDAHDLTRPVAVLDWEMTTIGDPLLDLAVSLSYWVTADDPEELQKLLPVVTSQPGFLSRAACMQLYASKSGRDLSSMHFYMVFAYFKLAVILQQIYVRWLRGQTLDQRFAAFRGHIRTLILHAAQLAERGESGL